MADPVDEYDVQQPKESDGTKPNDNDNLELFKADDDNKKTYCLVGMGRGDTSLAIDIKSHESAFADPTEQLMSVSAAKHSSTQGTQQQHNNFHRKQQQQAGQVEEKEKEEKERKGEGERGQEGRKEEEKEAGEGGGEQIRKDVTDWVEVRRRTRRKNCKMVQIFVKVNGSKATPMEVNLTDDKVEDVMRQIQKDEDVYVTLNGKVLRRDEKLRSCGVIDGCTIQVASRMRGGGRHKDKKSKVEKKQVARQEPVSSEGPVTLESDKEAVIQMLEENEGYRKIVEKEVMRNTGCNASERNSVKSQGWTRAK